MMSAESSSSDSERAPSSIAVSSPLFDTPPTRQRTPRSRLVRIGSTTDSVISSPGTTSEASGNTSGFLGPSQYQQTTQPQSSPLMGAPYTEVSTLASPSLLQPASRTISDRSATQTRQQQRQRQAEEDALLAAITGNKTADAAAAVTLVDMLKPTWESARAAPAALTKPPPPSLSATARSMGNGSPKGAAATSAFMSSTLPGGGGGGFGAAGSRPTSSTGRPGSSHANSTTAMTASVFNGGSRGVEGQKVTSPNSTALLFPTTEWIRTALGMAAGGDGDRKAGDARKASQCRNDTSGNSKAGGVGGGTGRSATTATGAGAASAAAAAGSSGTNAGAGAAPSSRDTAMRLHERRVQDAMRSQDEMREFSVILRRLEDEGAQILKEQRRRRHGRQGSAASSRQRGRGRAKRETRRVTAAAGGADGGGNGAAAMPMDGDDSRGVDDDSSDNFTDVSEDEDLEEEGEGADTPMLNEGNTAGRSAAGAGAGGAGRAGPSARVVAEVQGAENMSRVALIKLRDRTAREWVVLQRRRLEQRRLGPAALHRNMHASQLRLQATRTRGVHRAPTESQQKLLTITNEKGATGKRGAAPSNVMGSTLGAGLTEVSLPLDAGATLLPAEDADLAISWGENRLSAATAGGVNADGMAVERKRDGDDAAGESVDEGYLHADDACSVDSANAEAAAALAAPTSSPSTPAEVNSQHAVARGGPQDWTSPVSGEGPSLPCSPMAQTQRRADDHDTPPAAQAAGTSAGALVRSDSAADTAHAPTANPLLEDARLRRELQRLLFQANECTLYGLEQCLSGKQSTSSATAAAAGGGGTTKHTGTSTPSKNRSTNGGSPSKKGTDTPVPLSPQRAWSPASAIAAGSGDPLQRRGSTLPLPLHRTFGNYGGIASPGSGNRPSNSVSVGASRSLEWPRNASRAEQAETSQSSQLSFAEHGMDRHAAERRGMAERESAGAAEEGAALAHTPSDQTPVLPPLSTSSSPVPSPLLPGRRGKGSSAATAGERLTSTSLTPPNAKPSASRSEGTSLPSMSPAKPSAATTPPPHRFASPSSKKKHQRRPLPVERGVGEHAAVLLQHEILLTRRHELEVERGNAREIDRACATLQQLMPLREQLLDQDITKGSNSGGGSGASGALRSRQYTDTLKHSKRSSAGQPLLLPGTTLTDGEGTSGDKQTTTTTTTSPTLTTPLREGAQRNTDAAVDRSYHPQAILQRHRQLLYEEAVRMETKSRYAARAAYLDVLTELAQRHVSSVSWPVVEKMLAEAREQLRYEVETSPVAVPAAATNTSTTSTTTTTTTTTAASAASEQHQQRRRASPTSWLASATPREKLQHLISAHLGVLELSQWPVQEVLQHLAALYRVPLYLLHEGIAEQQRRFAHTYNYEERFRTVDRTVVGSGAGGDCVLRLTLHRCRRPPLTPAREAAAASSSSTTTTAAAAAAAAAHSTHGGSGGIGEKGGGAADLESRGEALYFVRLRVGQQTVSSSAVPVSSITSTSRSNSGRGGLRGYQDDADVEDAGDNADDNGRGGAFGGAASALYGSGAAVSGSASASAAKVLSFLSQTLTVYLTPADIASRKKRSDSRVVGRGYRYGSKQNNGGAGGDGLAGIDDGDEGCVLTVELMQSGHDTPLARGEVNLATLGLNTYGGSNRVPAQNVQIPLKRKGYRTAELKATLEITS